MNHSAKIDERDDAKSSSNVVPFRPALGEPVPIGEVVAAVIMRLQTPLPRVWVQTIEGEDNDRLL